MNPLLLRRHRRWLLLAAFLSAGLRSSALRAADPSVLSLPLGGGQTLELRRVESGSFTRRLASGDNPSAPQTTVTITRPFALGVRPVTRGQFARFVAATGHRTEAEKGQSGGFGLERGELIQRPGFSWRDPGFAQTDADPVVLVTRGDAEAFLRWLGTTAAGRGEFLFPTEAQWELAARAGYPGDQPDGQPVHRRDEPSAAGGSPASGGPRREGWRNRLGFDLIDSGVREWCRDWDGPAPFGLFDPVQDNANAASPSRGILRGRSWFRDTAGPLSFSGRHRASPGSRQADISFRVLLPNAAGLSPAVPGTTTGAAASPGPTTAGAAIPPAATPPESPDVTPAPATTPTGSAPSAAGSPEGNYPYLGLGFLVLGFFLGIAGLLLWGVIWVARRVWRGLAASASAKPPAPPTRPSRPPPPPVNVRQRVEITEDGFWVQSDAPAGTSMRCLFNVGDERLTRTLLFQPGPRGMFIGTGARPSAITVVPDLGPSGGPRGGGDVGDEFDGFAATGASAGFRSGAVPPPIPGSRRRSREPGAYH